MDVSLKDQWKELLRDNHETIVDGLYPDHVMDKLVAKHIMSLAIVEDLERLPRRRQVRGIMDRVLGQTENEMQQFISCLKQEEPALHRTLLEDADRRNLLTNGQMPIDVRHVPTYYTDQSYVPYPTRVASQMSGMSLSSNSLANSDMSDNSSCGTGPVPTARKNFAE